MKFELLEPGKIGRELWQAYAHLRDARAIYDDPFFDPDFARLVGEVREDTRIAFATLGGDVVGVWPMHVRPGNWARPIGGPFSDWHGPVLKAGLALSYGDFLGGLGLSGMTAFALLPQSPDLPAGFERNGSHLSDLSMGWQAFIDDQQAQWPKHFKKMRRLYRNVERDFSVAQLDWDSRSDATFDRLIALKREQYSRTGLHDVLKSDWALRLLDRLRHFEGPRLRARLISLHFDGKLAAAEFNLQSDRVMHGWITGFEAPMGVYSPGNMLVQDMLARMPDAGLQVYDSGPGLDHYKRHYSNAQMPIDAGILRSPIASVKPSRLAGMTWRRCETLLPGKTGELLTRTRRRVDQIVLAEPALAGRIGGIFSALSQRDL